jgi:hypothetical protein
MENPNNEDIIIPVCILLIVAGIQQYITKFHEILSNSSRDLPWKKFMVHGKKERRKRRRRIIIIRNGAKTISLQMLFGRVNKTWLEREKK